MARYEVLELSYIGDRLVRPGTVVEYDGLPGGNLRPLDPPVPLEEQIDELLE